MANIFHMHARKRTSQYRGQLLWLLLLISLLGVLGWLQWHARRTGATSPVDTLLMEFLSPSLRVAGNVRNRYTAVPSTPGASPTQVGLARLRQLEEDNRQLRALLQLRNTIPTPAIAAEVIGRSATPWEGYVLLDKGRQDGLAPQMVALTPEGVLGQVAFVTAHTARVLPLTDRSSGIPAMVVRTLDPGVLKGATAGKCQLTYLTGESDVRVGDQLVTSGLGRIFPKGYPLGTVLAVSRNPANSSREALIAPAVKPATVSMVVVIAAGSRERTAQDGADGTYRTYER